MDHGQRGMRSENTVVPLAQSNLVTSQDQYRQVIRFKVMQTPQVEFCVWVRLTQRHSDTLISHDTHYNLRSH